MDAFPFFDKYERRNSLVRARVKIPKHRFRIHLRTRKYGLRMNERTRNWTVPFSLEGMITVRDYTDFRCTESEFKYTIYLYGGDE